MAEEIGGLYVISYSGALIVQDLAQFASKEIVTDGRRLILDPPVRLASLTWRPIPQADDNNIRRIIQIPAGVRITPLRLAVFPAFVEGGTPGLRSHIDLPEGEGSLEPDAPPDTFLVHVYGKNEGNGAQLAEEIINNLLSWLRVMTLQWWIGQPSEPVSGNLQLRFSLSAERHIDGFPTPRCRATTPGEDARPVSPDMWLQALEKVQQERQPPRHKLLLLDAEYNYFSGNYSVCIILVISAFEIIRNKILETQMARSAVKKIGTDILKHVKELFEEKFKRNLEKEKPECFEFLRACWVARGHVAHGKELLWRWGGGEMNFKDYPANKFFQQVRTIEIWLSSIVSDLDGI